MQSKVMVLLAAVDTSLCLVSDGATIPPRDNAVSLRFVQREGRQGERLQATAAKDDAMSLKFAVCPQGAKQTTLAERIICEPGLPMRCPSGWDGPRPGGAPIRPTPFYLR